MILTIFECLNQICLVLLVNSWTISLRTFLLEIHSVLSSLIELLSFIRKFDSFMLFLKIVCFLVWICSSNIAISTISRTWSNENLHFGQIIWLLISEEIGCKNIRSMTKFESLELSEYLAETWLVDLEIQRFKICKSILINQMMRKKGS